jgi:hypothetical protein
MKVSIVLTIILVFFGIVLFPIFVEAQSFSSEWTDPEQLYFVTDGLRSNYLATLYEYADKVYLWWGTFRAIPDDTSEEEPKFTTFHAQNNKGDWRSPIDVMIWPDAGRMISVIIDPSGFLHAFSATDCLNYTTARNDQALSAQGWTNMGCLDEAGLAFPSAVQAPDGTFYVLYSALNNQSYRLIHSEDKGTTWSGYKTILEIQNNFLLDPMLAVDEKGRLHLVWSVGQAPDAYPPTGVFYSRSIDGGISWAPPIQLGGRDEGEPAIAVNNDEVHVLWNGDADKKGRYYRYSPDGGESWSSVDVLSPPGSEGGKGGLQRPPAIVVDNIGNVHVLLHEQESLYYASKTESGWSTRQALYNPDLMNGVEIFGVRLAITGGDTLHAMYILESYDRSKDEDRRNHIWRVFHQSRVIDSMRTTPVPWSTSTHDGLASLSLGEVSPTVANTVVPNVVQDFNTQNDDLSRLDQYNPSSSMYVGFISALIFLSVVFLFYSISRIRYNK